MITALSILAAVSQTPGNLDASPAWSLSLHVTIRDLFWCGLGVLLLALALSIWERIQKSWWPTVSFKCNRYRYRQLREEVIRSLMDEADQWGKPRSGTYPFVMVPMNFTTNTRLGVTVGFVMIHNGYVVSPEMPPRKAEDGEEDETLVSLVTIVKVDQKGEPCGRIAITEEEGLDLAESALWWGKSRYEIGSHAEA